MSLRPYQLAAREGVRARYLRGERAALVVLPTGTGKTRTALSMAADTIRRGRRVLWLAHRSELIDQPVKAWRALPELADVGTAGAVMADQDEAGAQLVCASVQTLARGDRLARVLAAGLPSLIVVDEAHHSAAGQWRTVLDQVDAAAAEQGAKRPWWLGLTATPERTDRADLSALWGEEPAYVYTYQEAIADGYLCPPDFRLARLEMDAETERLLALASERDDESEMARLMLRAGVVEHTARAMAEHAQGRRCLVFTADVTQAVETRAALMAAGLRAAMVSGETPAAQRRAILRSFEREELDAICNCLDQETEILTDRGWVGIDDFQQEDVTAAVDMDTMQIRWEPVSRVIRRPVADGERMVRICNQTLDIRVTEGHRMVVRAPGATGWKIVEAGTLPLRRGPYELPLAGVQAHEGVELTDAELELLGLFATDGTLNRQRASLEFTQSLAYSSNCREIERILTQCGFDWKFYDYAPRGEPQARWRRYRVPKGNLSGALKRNGWGRLQGWLDKSLSPRLAGCTRRQFERLVYGLWLGDGYKHVGSRKNCSPAICGIDWTLFNRVQSWAAVRGFASNLFVGKNEAGGRSPGSVLGVVRIRDRMTVRTNNHQVQTSGGNPARFEEPVASERVWCVTNATGTIITRRRGRVVVMGQCAVLTEGTDLPVCDAVVLARPFSSKPLYVQAVGRGLRLYQGKESCLVLDLVGASEEHSMIMAAALLPPPTDGKDQRVPFVGTLRRRVAGLVPPLRVRCKPAEDLEQPDGRGWALEAMRVGDAWVPLAGDLVRVPGDVERDPADRVNVPDVWRERSPVMADWARVERGVWACDVGQHGLVMLVDLGDGWMSYLWRKKARKPQAMGRRPCPEEVARSLGDDLFRQAQGLVRRDAEWKRRLPSEAARDYAHRMGIDTAGMDAGQLSHAIAVAKGREKWRRTGLDGFRAVLDAG